MRNGRGIGKRQSVRIENPRLSAHGYQQALRFQRQQFAK